MAQQVLLAYRQLGHGIVYSKAAAASPRLLGIWADVWLCVLKSHGCIPTGVHNSDSDLKCPERWAFTIWKDSSWRVEP